MDDSRVRVIKGSRTSTLSWNEAAAKQKMTGVAALQSYLENRFEYWRYRGGSFATLDMQALFLLSSREWRNTFKARKRIFGFWLYGCSLLANCDRKREKAARVSVASDPGNNGLLFSSGFNCTVWRLQGIN